MKKILALLMTCALLVSMTCMVSASTGATISVSNLTAADIVEDPDGGNYYMVAVNMDKLYTESTTLSQGYNAMQFDLVYDDTIVAPHDYGVWGTDDGWGWSFKQGPSWKKEALSASSAIVDVDGKKAVRVVMQTGSVTKTLLNRGAGDQSLLYFAFAPVAEAGKGTFSVKNIVFSVADESAIHYDADFTIVDGSIDLGGEIVPPTPEVPEVSTVKTFPKLKWDAETGSLTTVGVVTIGKDIEGMKYGINIVKGEGTVNYWTDKTVLTTSGAEAYYAIQLDGIKDTTDITINSASKAVLSNGAAGEAVTYVAE